jgi:hypothetical protein
MTDNETIAPSSAKPKPQSQKARRTPALPVEAPAAEDDVSSSDDEIALVDDDPSWSPPRAVPATSKAPPLSTITRQISEQEEQSLKEMLEGFGQEGAIKVSVYRKTPTLWKGKKCDGLLQSYEEFLDEEFIKERHGGGRYQLKIFKRTAKGSWQFARSRTIDIAGDPRVVELSNDEDEARGPSASEVAAVSAAATARAEVPLMAKAMEMMERSFEKASSRPVSDHGPLLEMMKQMVASAEAQVTVLQAELRDLRTKPKAPEDQFKDQLLGKMIDGDTARITALRATYDSEIRQLKEAHRDDEKRWQSRMDEERKALRDQNEREVANLKQSYELQMTVQRASHEVSTKVLEGEVRRYEAEVKELRTELRELRNKKDQTITEKAKELQAVRDALDSGKEGGDGGSIVGDVVGKVFESPMAQALAKRLASAASDTVTSPAPAQPQLPPVGQPFRAQDGNAYVRMPDGNIVPYRPQPRQRRPGRSPGGRPAAPAPGQSPEPSPPPATDLAAELGLAPADIQMAVTFLEGAYKANADHPEVVAASVRTMIPESLLQVIRQRGVDVFLDQVAQLDSGSPLAQQKGRNFARRVAKILLDGGGEEAAADE